MDLTNKFQLIEFLKTNHLWSQKRLGQNFLIDKNGLEKIVEVAELKQDDTILEIGPGVGTLTWGLSPKVKNGLILAVEKDYKLVELLRRQFKNARQVKIVHQDIRRFDLCSIEGEYKVVANIPYYLTSQLIRKLLEARCEKRSLLHQNPKSEIQNPNEIQNSNFKNSEIHSKNLKFKHSSFAYKPPQLIVLTIQKEMADRITAQPGDSNRGILTIMVELLAEAEIVAFVPRSSFYPEPEVDSAVIRLRPRKHLRSGVAPAAHFGGEGIGRALKNSKTKKLKDVDYNLVMHIAKAGFSAKRRQLHNSLSGGLGLSVSQVKNLLQATDIDPQKRAEELTVLEWQEIANEWLKLLRAHRS